MNCPNTKSLQALLDETLSAEEQPTIQTHLETCERCQKVLERLAAGGVTWDKAAENLTPKPAGDETALLQAVNDLQSAPTKASQTQTGAAASADTEDLSFLQPPQKPGALGRLDKYDILAVVGKGGFGIVLKGFDESLHRVVAIKVMSPQIASNGAARQRFIREAKAAAGVTHENVVTIHEVKKDAPVPYLVMQFVSGVTLADKIESTGALGLKEILRIAMQTAEGLAAAHKQGLVHRDIKPANILLENGVERVKITDFGLARLADDASITQSGVIAGTPMFMSPEQADGKPIDHRSDLFSLGSVLYVMCTGKAPFRAASTMAVLKRVCEETPRPIRESNSELPEWLDGIVTKLHAKKPEERFQTASEVAELLGQHLAEVQAGRAEGRKPPVGAPATVAFTPVAHAPGSQKARRNRWVVALPILAGAFVVAVGLATGFLGEPPWTFHRGDKSEPVSQPPVVTVASTVDDILKDAILLMNFEKDTFYEKDGKTYVRDLSGHGNDGLCDNVALTPDGKSGGGLKCTSKGRLRVPSSLFNRRSNYTVTGWVRLVDDGRQNGFLGGLCGEGNPSMDADSVFFVAFTRDKQATVAAWNKDHKQHWLNSSSEPAINTQGTWFFMAVTLENGGTDSGILKMNIDGKEYQLASQMVDHPLQQMATNFGAVMDGTLDELTVFHRALSAQETETIRQRGIEGKPLAAKPPIPTDASDLLRDALLLMNFEKNTFYEKDGKTYVRDLSGHGHDGICNNVGFTADGKAGAGLLCKKGGLDIPKKFFTGRSNYTLAAWVFYDETFSFIQEFAADNQCTFTLTCWPDHLFANAWNWDYPENWKTTRLPLKFSPGSWHFVAIRLKNGAVGRGELLATYDEHTMRGTWQREDSGETGYSRIAENFVGKLDELVILPRALSDEEVHLLYQQGRQGRPLRKIDIKDPPSNPPVRPGPGPYALRFEKGSVVDVDTLRLKRATPLTVEGYFTAHETKYPSAASLLGGEFFGLFIHQNTARWSFAWKGKEAYNEIGTVPVVNGQRHHIAGVRAKNEIRLYLDGKKIASQEVGEDAGADALPPFKIGGTLFVGLIQEVRISKSARYDESFTPEPRFKPDSDTVALYHFDEGTGNLLNDASGNGYHGSITGAKWVKTDGSPITPSEPSWVQLFNGKDMTGWQKHLRFDGNWHVASGNLVCSQTHNAWLFTDRLDYTNFHLHAEFKIERGAAAVILRASPGDGVVAAVYGVSPPGYEIHLAPSGDQWHTLDAHWNGNRHVVKIDGKLIRDAEDGAARYRTGQIALQVIGPQPLVRFKKIEIKELPAEEPGWVQLFNGKDLSGWVPINSSPEWFTVKDGEFIVTTSHDKGAVTGNDLGFANFHLRAEAKLSPNGSAHLTFWPDPRPGKGRYSVGLGADLTGVLAGPVGEAKNSKKMPAPPEWFLLEVLATGDRITVKIDGVITSDYRLTEVDRQNRGRSHRLILTTNHRTILRFRKIEIKELPLDAPPRPAGN